MALTTDLEDMRVAVQRTADVVAFTDKHPVERINDLINQGLGALSRICRTTNPEFQPIASSPITFDGVATAYPLPVNFRSLLMVEYIDDEGRKRWLTPHNFNERASLTTPTVQADSLRATSYRLLGTNIEFLPRPPDDHSARIWYATTVTQLTQDAQAWDTMERLDSYVIWWAAREIAMEREAWERHDRLSQKLSDLEADIRILARSLDLSTPTRVTELAYGNFPRSRRRYRR